MDLINRIKLRTKLNTLLSIMNSTDKTRISQKISIFNMSSEMKKQFSNGIRMGYNDYGLADSIKMHLINEISLPFYPNESVTTESVNLYIEFAIDNTMQYIINEKPEYIHYVV